MAARLLFPTTSSHRSIGSFALAAWVAAAGACTSSSTGNAPTGASDAGADTSARDGAPSPPPEQDPNVYPATHYPIPLAKNAGGSVLFAPEIVTVTFTGDAMASELQAFDDVVTTLAWWRAVAHPYGIDVGKSGGAVALDDTVSGKTLDNEVDVKPFIQAMVQAGKLPAPNAQTIYVFYFPAAATIAFGGGTSCAPFRGYHDSVPVRLTANGPVVADVAYAVVPRCSTVTSDLTYAASHEIVEAATDPHPSESGKTSWYLLDNIAWAGAGGGELADLCVAKTPYVTSGYSLARSWSNDAAKASQDPCQPSDAGKLFYGAAVETETVRVSDQAGTHDSDGYITIARGQTKIVYATVFSEAALPGELALFVGKRTASTDPTALAPITKGVDASLSRGAAHNGQVVALTLTAAIDATVGDHPFVVRSVLSPTDYHSWPVVLRVE